MRSIEDIILEKKYDELSPEELVMVSELAESEEEFNRMKQLFDNMSFGFGDAEVFEASPETKNSLDSVFIAKHPVIANDWKKEEEAAQDVKVVAFYNRNWVRVAAVLLVFLGISVVYIQNEEEINPQPEPQQAKANLAAKKPNGAAMHEVQSADTKAAESPKQEKVQLAVVTLPQTTWTKSDISQESYDELSAMAKDMSVGEQQATTLYAAPPVLSGSFSSGNTYAFSTAEGLNSDLYPNGKTIQDKKASGSTDVPASDMLDWIQAAY